MFTIAGANLLEKEFTSSKQNTDLFIFIFNEDHLLSKAKEVEVSFKKRKKVSNYLRLRI